MYDVRYLTFDVVFRRIIIPIIDDECRVIGFSGRVVDRGMPKYLNSRETMVFDKSRSLFGLDHVKDKAAQYIILCEGCMDVMALHQAGFDMAVMPLGVRFTLEQAKIIKGYAHDVMVCYDSDESGKIAASNTATILSEAGMSVKQIDMSPHMDPQEYIAIEGGTAFGELLRTVLD